MMMIMTMTKTMAEGRGGGWEGGGRGGRGGKGGGRVRGGHLPHLHQGSSLGNCETHPPPESMQKRSLQAHVLAESSEKSSWVAGRESVVERPEGRARANLDNIGHMQFGSLQAETGINSAEQQDGKDNGEISHQCPDLQREEQVNEKLTCGCRLLRTNLVRCLGLGPGHSSRGRACS